MPSEFEFKSFFVDLFSFSDVFRDADERPPEDESKQPEKMKNNEKKSSEVMKKQPANTRAVLADRSTPSPHPSAMQPQVMEEPCAAAANSPS